MYAICLKCGADKKTPYDPCDRCGFQPKDYDSMEKSVYLSLGRYDTFAEQSKYEHELRELASELNRGQEIEFDVEELSRLRRQRMGLELEAGESEFRYLLRVFFPGLLFLLAIAAVLMALKLR